MPLGHLKSMPYLSTVSMPKSMPLYIPVTVMQLIRYTSKIEDTKACLELHLLTFTFKILKLKKKADKNKLIVLVLNVIVSELKKL